MSNKENRSHSQIPQAATTSQENTAGRSQSMNRTLHDKEAFMTKKVTESAPFFRQARVQTCSHVMMKNGMAVAVAFPLEKTGWKHPNSYANTTKSSQTDSWAR